MKIKKTYSLYIEELSEDQLYKVYNFLSEQVKDKMLFAFYAHQEDCSIVVEYLDEEYFEKISNFLKTL